MCEILADMREQARAAGNDPGRVDRALALVAGVGLRAAGLRYGTTHARLQLPGPQVSAGASLQAHVGAENGGAIGAALYNRRGEMMDGKQNSKTCWDNMQRGWARLSGVETARGFGVDADLLDKIDSEMARLQEASVAPRLYLCWCQSVGVACTMSAKVGGEGRGKYLIQEQELQTDYDWDAYRTAAIPGRDGEDPECLQSGSLRNVRHGIRLVLWCASILPRHSEGSNDG